MTAPDGGHWRVRRRWLDRQLPDLRQKFRAGRKENLEEGVLGALPSTEGADGWPAIALAVAVVLIVFVLLPLLGVALELIAVIFFLAREISATGRPQSLEIREAR